MDVIKLFLASHLNSMDSIEGLNKAQTARFGSHNYIGHSSIDFNAIGDKLSEQHIGFHRTTVESSLHMGLVQTDLGLNCVAILPQIT